MDTAGETRELAETSRGIQEHPKALTQKHHKATASKPAMIMSSIPDAGDSLFPFCLAVGCLQRELCSRSVW